VYNKIVQMNRVTETETETDQTKQNKTKQNHPQGDNDFCKSSIYTISHLPMHVTPEGGVTSLIIRRRVAPRIPSFYGVPHAAQT